ncbi:hypothetical protein ACRRTK_019281 [Alexandromys fortis]
MGEKQKEQKEPIDDEGREFISSLRLHRSFYGGLADQLCITELAAAEGRPCWNGEDIVKSMSLCAQTIIRFLFFHMTCHRNHGILSSPPLVLVSFPKQKENHGFEAKLTADD